jgi:AhpD family alkylhydroperoxidase
MTAIRLIDDTSAPLLVRELFEDGDPGPIAAALAQVPELCVAAMPFLGTSLGPTRVSLRRKEIAILRTSANFSCRYCVDAHTVVARDSGLTDAETRSLRNDPGAEGLGDVFDDPAEQALIEWIDALSNDRGPVAPHVTDHVKEHLSDDELVDITITVGTTILLNRFASGLGLPTSTDTIQRLQDLGYRTFEPPRPVTVRGTI